MRGRAAAALLGALALAGCGAGAPSTPRRLPPTRAVALAPPRPGRVARPRAAPLRPPLGALVLRRTVLRASPGGRVLATLRRRTEFHSPRVLGVLGRRSGWVRVAAAELPNGRFGWVRARAVGLFSVGWTIDASLSRRELVVRRAGRVVARVAVAIGRPSNPTPTGRFAVTDKLLITDASPYGCCALALSGHQPDTPPGWPGGDRLAIHATDAPASIGQAASLGCLRAPAAALRRLVREIPLGTPVRIRAEPG